MFRRPSALVPRRSYRRRKAARRSRPMVRQIPREKMTRIPMLLRFPLPRSAYCLHSYNTTLTMNLPATSDTAYFYQFASNDIFNPDPDSAAYRATFWDEMRALY